MSEQELNPGDPYCFNCGYALIGVTASTQCPECGKAIVDVLVRHDVKRKIHSKRFRSRTKIMGMPLLDIAFGPIEGESTGRARGFIAIGTVATGWLAIGVFARGIVAIGGFAFGGLSLGIVSLGLLGAVGAAAVGGLAAGAVACGVMAAGLGSMGFIAQGEGAIGYYIRASDGLGKHIINQSGASSQEVVDVFSALGWYFNSGSPGPMYIIQPVGVTFLIVLSGVIFLVLMAMSKGAQRGTRLHT